MIDKHIKDEIKRLGDQINANNDSTYLSNYGIKPDPIQTDKVLKKLTDQNSATMYRDMLKDVIKQQQKNPYYRFDALKNNLANWVEQYGIEDAEKIRKLTPEQAQKLIQIEPDFFNFKMRYERRKGKGDADENAMMIAQEHLQAQEEFKKKLELVIEVA